jgi:hypothetical protein
MAAAALALVCAWQTGTLWAKDSVDVSVTNAGGALVVPNGQTPGTIQLFYTVTANQFVMGALATFDVNWATVTRAGENATDYGSGIAFTLTQAQQGGFVDLVPGTPEFKLTETGQSGKSTITIHIGPDKSGTVPPSTNGTDLVGNLKLHAGSKLETPTSIQVHIVLVHPTACVKVYNFVTDQGFNGILGTTSLKIGTNGPKAGKVISSNPSQFSDNVLIVNTCGTDQSFDLGIGLDSSFTTSSNGNPVKTYTAEGEFDDATFSAMMTPSGTPHQENLCLPNLTVAAGTSLLATVHSEVRKDWPQGSLPTDNNFDFVATLYQDVNAGCSGSPHSMAQQELAAFTLPFIKTY